VPFGWSLPPPVTPAVNRPTTIRRQWPPASNTPCFTAARLEKDGTHRSSVFHWGWAQLHSWLLLVLVNNNPSLCSSGAFVYQCDHPPHIERIHLAGLIDSYESGRYDCCNHNPLWHGRVLRPRYPGPSPTGRSEPRPGWPNSRDRRHVAVLCFRMTGVRRMRRSASNLPRSRTSRARTGLWRPIASSATSVDKRNATGMGWVSRDRPFLSRQRHSYVPEAASRCRSAVVAPGQVTGALPAHGPVRV